jgi:hypothetical protein
MFSSRHQCFVKFMLVFFQKMFVGKYSDGPWEVTFAFKDGTLTITKNVSFDGAHQVIHLKCVLILL